MVSILEDLTSTTNPLSNPTVHPQVVAHVPQANDSRMIVRESDTPGVNWEELLLEAFMAEFTVEKGQRINQRLFSLNMPIRFGFGMV